MVKETIVITFDNYEFHVMKSFTDICPDFKDKTLKQLCMEYNLDTYLHNLEDYAVKHLVTAKCLYYINGKLLNKSEWEKESQNYKFHKKLEDVING